LSITAIIPARNEKYLMPTIHSLLNNADDWVEVIAVLDGYWPDEELIEDPRVKYIHKGIAQGMRPALNSAVAAASGDYILKSDAHCMFEKGYDTALLADMEDNWVVVPRRYRLDVENWKVIEDGRPPIDYMFLTPDLHGKIWHRPDLENKMIDDLMSSQGSCYFIKKDYYHELELLDQEQYGSFFNEFQEIGLKCWLSGGQVKINKNTWYAHWHKNNGRGYSMGRSLKDKGEAGTRKWLEGTGWHKQVYPISWLVEKFGPVPGW
jgi:glycosyltransferase involved in cell wall biosynthesis